jgi:hypothetical protein
VPAPALGGSGYTSSRPKWGSPVAVAKQHSWIGISIPSGKLRKAGWWSMLYLVGGAIAMVNSDKYLIIIFNGKIHHVLAG